MRKGEVKKTRTQLHYEKKAEFVEFWNKQPSENEFAARMTGEIMHPYQLYYMIKYPNGGIPPVRVYKRRPVFKKRQNLTAPQQKGT